MRFFSHGGTKTRRLGKKVAVDGSGDSIAHERFAEIQKIAEFEASEAEVGR